MYKLLYAGFDTLDVAFAGSLPKDILAALAKAREEAQQSQTPSLVTIGPGRLDAHVAGHGMRGGYAFLLDTGPLGAKWMVKDNSDSRQWNLFASPRATALLAYSYEGTRDQLRKQLEDMGARVTDHSINRVDFAMDFQTQGFELRQDQFVAHSHTKVMPHWGKPEQTTDHNQPSAVLRGRRLESITIGKQPGRQIIVYDKRREAIERQKPFWFEAWGVDRADPALEVWRVEVRAGKKELKDKHQLRTFEDFAASIGDVIVNALADVRYLADRQLDGNVSRQFLHPLWTAAQSAADHDLLPSQPSVHPAKILEIERALAVERHAMLVLGNALAWGAANGLTLGEITAQLPVRIMTTLTERLRTDGGRVEKAFRRAQQRLRFCIGLAP